ncbi:MAG: TolC family protein [Salinivirgaceae bacterium]|nr:TolC family protein [Salinivirgaceae bacterium]
MKKKKYILATFALIAFGLLSFKGMAQELWSLEKCVNYAIENNIQIKQQALNVNYNENELEKAKFNIYPNLNANVSESFDFGLSTGGDNVNVSGNSMRLGASLSSNMTLFNGFAKRNTIKQRDFNLQASLKDLEKAKDDIALSVASAYLDILFNKELVATSQEQLEITNQQIEYNKKQVDAGNMAKGKLLETEAQLAAEELTLTNNENQLQLSKLNLIQLLELKEINGFDIVTPVFDEASITSELLNSNQVFAKAVLERPEIISKELQLQSAEKNNEIAKAQKLPVLSLSASIGDSYSHFFDLDNASFTDQFNDYLRTSVGLNLSIPIFNGFSAKLNHQNALINYENKKYELQFEKNNLLKEIQQVHANATAAMKRYYSSEKALKSAEEAFRYVQEKFTLGIVTPLEFNDSKNKVSSAQSSFIQAKYEYIFRIKILDFYNGKEITL